MRPTTPWQGGRRGAGRATTRYDAGHPWAMRCGSGVAQARKGDGGGVAGHRRRAGNGSGSVSHESQRVVGGRRVVERWGVWQMRWRRRDCASLSDTKVSRTSAALRPRAIHQSRRPPSRLRLPWLRAAQCTRLTRLASPWGTSGLVRPHRRPCDASAVHRLGRHCSTYIHLHTPGRRRLEHFGGRY
jgi:hypothetical protein